MEKQDEEATRLSYEEMSTDESGQILPRHKKEAVRRELGYCLTCPRVPVLLFDIRRSKLNPLKKVKKVPLEIPGKCSGGTCLKCFPNRRACSDSTGAQLDLDSYGSFHAPSSSRSSMGLSKTESKRWRTTASGSMVLARSMSTRSRLHSSGSSACSSLLDEVSAQSIDNTCPSVNYSSNACSPKSLRIGERELPGRDQTESNRSLHSQSRRLSSNGATGSRRRSSNGASGSRRRSSNGASSYRSEHSRESSMESGSIHSTRRPSRRVRRPSNITVTPESRPHSPLPVGSTNFPNTNDELHASGPNQRQINYLDQRSDHAKRASSSHNLENPPTGGRPLTLRRCSSNDETGIAHRNRSNTNGELSARRGRRCLSNNEDYSRRTNVAQEDNRLPNQRTLISGRRISCPAATSSENIRPSPLLRSKSSDTPDSYLSNEPDHRLSRRPTSRVVQRQPLRNRPGVGNPTITNTVVPQNGSEDFSYLDSLFQEIRSTNCPDLWAEGILSALIQHQFNEAACVVGTREVARVVGSDATYAEHFVKLGGHKTLIESALAFETSSRLQALCCNALLKIAEVEGTRIPLILDGTCSFLTKMLVKELGNENLTADALGVMRIFSTVLSARQELLQHNVSNITVDVMACNPQNAAVQRDGCAVIANMAYDDGEVLPVDEIAIEVVWSAMVNNLNQKSVVSSASFALNNLALEENNLRAIAALSNVFATLERVHEHTAQELLQKMFVFNAEVEANGMIAVHAV